MASFTPEEYSYSLLIRRVGAAKALFESLDHWQTSFLAVSPQESRTRAFWSADSRFIVLAFESFNHTQSLRMFSVHNRTASEVPLPDYIQSVRAALAGESIKSLIAEPIGWTNGDLKLSLSGTTGEPRAGTNDYDFNFSAVLQLKAHNGTAEADLSALHSEPSVSR